jgi:ADP-heptose:LPS heptosyltransferase
VTAELVVLRALGLGDFLTGVPAYRGLRRAFPDHRIVLAAPPGLAGLATLTGAVHEVLPSAELAPLAWDREPPAVAVNLHGQGPQSHRVLDALSPGQRIGYPAPGWDGPPWREDEHETDRWSRLLAHHGIASDPTDLRLPAPPEPPPVRRAVIVHPGAAYGCRRWPVDRYASVAGALAAEGCRVVVTGGSAERNAAEMVARGAGLPPGAVLAGATDARELAALIADAALVVCGDTGVGHLATAFGSPSVLLFGPTPPACWGPRTGGPHRGLWHPEQLLGDRFSDAPDPALLAITPAEVLAAAHALLGPAGSDLYRRVTTRG